MKKTLVTLALAIAFGGMTTGCAAKKRVQRLEEELLRCKQRKQELQQQLKSDAEEPEEERPDAVARVEDVESD